MRIRRLNKARRIHENSFVPRLKASVHNRGAFPQI